MKVSNLADDTEDFTGNIWYIDNSEHVLIDVGTGDSWKNIEVIEKVDKVIITHSHHDHVDNLEKVDDRFDADVYAYQPSNLSVEALELNEGDEIEICGEKYEVFHTPGHKDDSICIYSQESGKLFTGDLIFPDGGFGRTDLDEGDRDRLIESIKKISALDVESFYPGHGQKVEEAAEEGIMRSLEDAKEREPKY